MNKIAVIIVTYNPDMRQIEETIHSIAKQVFYVIIIDNGNTRFLIENIDNLIIINLGENYGIAYAQNRGIELAFKLNAQFIIFSDQDTIFPNDYVSKNKIAYEQLKYHNLAALVPVFFNSQKKTKNPVMITKFLYTVDFSVPYIKTAHAISSGTFMSSDSLKAIGGMNEKLFIDYVDFEWCWRATKLGYNIFTIPDIIINHRLGDNVKVIFKRQVTLRKDIRYFYMLRNAFFLACYSPYLKLYERILLAKRGMLHAFGIFFIKHDWSILKLILLAIFEGLTGHMNQYKQVLKRVIL
jgi:rhamnosyltransferase